MIRHLRWYIAGAICLGMALNYLDRQVLSVLATDIRQAFHLTSSDYARIVFAFQLSYMLSSSAGGRLADWIGVRLAYAGMMAFWSAAGLLHAVALGRWSLTLYRFLLGLGEGGAFPTCVKAVSEWFPRRERALAVGLMNSSLSLGGILAPPLTAFLAIQFGWRAAFVAVGSLGFLWLLVWLPLYHSPRAHPRVRPEEIALIASDTLAESRDEPPVRTLQLLRMPQMIWLCLARLVADPPWQFYMFWLPEYLRRARGMTLAQVGMLAWMPFLFAALGGILGGWASGRLIRRGMEPVRASKLVMAASAALLPAGILAVHAPTGLQAVLWVCLAGIGHVSWVSHAQALPSHVLPSRAVGTAVGLSQTSAYIGNLAATLLTGYLLDRFSYAPVFYAMSFLHPAATLLLLLEFRGQATKPPNP